MAIPKPEFDLVRRRLNYDPDTGVLTWRAGRVDNIGRVAGSKKTSGHIGVKLEGRTQFAHCLAWLWMTGEWPSQDIDHKNTDPADNRWSNLRLATDSQNLANARRHSNNKSGYKGVSWCRTSRKWRAQIKKDGAVIYLGVFSRPLEAHAAYVAKARELHGEFARAS